MIKLDYRNKQPIFKQIEARILEMIVLGVYPPDYHLPSVRAMAVELGINPNTIQKAYRELESMGAIYSVSGKGSFVSADQCANKLVMEKKRQEVHTAIKDGFLSGMTQEEMMQIVTEVYGKGVKSHD